MEIEKELQYSEFDFSVDYLTRGDIIATGFERCLKDLGHNYKVSFRYEDPGKENMRAVFRVEKVLEE